MAEAVPAAVADCVAGTISPQVAIGRLLLAGLGAQAIGQALDAAAPGPAVQAMRALAQGRGPALDALAAEVRATSAQHHAGGGTADEGVARIAAFFDHAVRHSPEASVAIYSLGDPDLMRAVTGELVGWLERQGLLRPGMDVLDVGCGIGRVMQALAPRCGRVLGLDVSPGMVAEAGRRLAGVPNAAVRLTDGQGLASLEAGGFDLVLVVDAFPYLHQAGVAQAHVRDAARLLRPGGALAVFNWSYESGPEQAAAEARAWAEQAGLVARTVMERPLRIWDGTATVLQRSK